MPSFKQALGLKKQPKETPEAKALRKAPANVAARKAEQANQKVATTAVRQAGKSLTVNDLEGQIKVLEKVTAKLVTSHAAAKRAHDGVLGAGLVLEQAARDRLQASYDAAYQVKTAAEKILAATGPLGPTEAARRGRLQHVIDENQLIWDEMRVEMSKRKAEGIYMKAGRAAEGLKGRGDAPGRFRGGAPPTTGGFAHLSSAAQQTGFGVAGNDGLGGLTQSIAQAGAKLGLSPADIAAINTFTNADYLYINPGVNKNEKWMRSANPAPDFFDKEDATPEEQAKSWLSLQDLGMTAGERAAERKNELASRRQEGVLHEGMALRALLKLPVWRGKAWRGEVWTDRESAMRYPYLGKGKYMAKNAVEKVNNIRSQTMSKAEAINFWKQSKSPETNRTNHRIVLWEIDIVDGRDIENLSSSPWEHEVATLPGAEFEVGSVEMTTQPDDKENRQHLFVKAKQRSTKAPKDGGAAG